jgi:hypothetical protein
MDGVFMATKYRAEAENADGRIVEIGWFRTGAEAIGHVESIMPDAVLLTMFARQGPRRGIYTRKVPDGPWEDALQWGGSV